MRSLRAGSVLWAVALGCGGAAQVRDGARAVDAEIVQARRDNGMQCAAQELAVADANLRFAQLELDRGDRSRAGEHLAVAQESARAAVRKSGQCKPVQVVIREKAAPQVGLKDSDGDGVPDIDDLCPDAPGPAWNRGCPVLTDRDGDGVPDDVDRCPDVAGPKENFGCPWPDRDHDGVADKDDLCPDEPGPADNHGCPRKQALVIVRKDRIELKQQVHFQPNRDRILPSSHELLREVAQAIKDAPRVSIRIEGHTDNVGKKSTNLKLSQKRAEAVRRYLVGLGVSKRQLVARGFGQSRPIASNSRRAGRAANRRVEFRIVEQASARGRRK